MRRWERRAFTIEGDDARAPEASQRLSLTILLGIACQGVAGVRPQNLAQVSAVAIDVVLAGPDDLLEQNVREHFRDRPVRLARRRAIEIEAVDRGEKARAPLEHRRIDDRDGDDRPGELLGIEALGPSA